MFLFPDGQQVQQEVPETRADVVEREEGSQEEEEEPDRRKLQLLGPPPDPRPAELCRKTLQEARPAQRKVRGQTHVLGPGKL